MHDVSSAHTPASNLRDVFGVAWDSVGGLAQGDAIACFFELDAWRPWLDAATGLLDEAEQGRVQRKQRAGDRDELALSYALHRLVLGRVLRCESEDVALRRDAVGRPYLPGDEVRTSLSHAGGVAAIAVSRHGAIGIDVERAARAGEMHEIAGHVCHPHETRKLDTLPGSARLLALLGLWVRKEALLKAAGMGLEGEMSTFEAPVDRPVPLPVEGGGTAIIRMLDVGPTWVAAAASVGAPQVHVAWLRPLPVRPV